MEIALNILEDVDLFLPIYVAGAALSNYNISSL